MEAENFEEEQDWPVVELTDLKPIPLVLSKRDSEIFVRALLNPPEPGEKLLAAVRRYKERMRDSSQ